MRVLDYAVPWRHRGLVWQFARREVLGRYRGSMLGVGWALVSPLLMLAAFTFVFVGVFKARWPGADDGHGGLEFGLQVFAGLLIFNWFAEVAGRAPRLILEQPNLVKKVVFPLQTLTWVSLLSSLFHMLLGLTVLTAATAWARGELPWTALSLPLVLLVFVPFLLGVSWGLAALGVYLRDIAQMMGLVISLAMFLSPVFYSTLALSGTVAQLMVWNPLTLIIESVRHALLDGAWPDWKALTVYAGASLVVAWAGAALFEKTRRGFADVL